MSPEFAYFLKVNIAFILFYAFYRLFFYKDTFFKLRRCILLAFFGLALIYPLFNIQEWIREQEPIIEAIQLYSAMLPEATVTTDQASTHWSSILRESAFYLYIGGVILLTIRFLLQISGILWLAFKSKPAWIQRIKVYILTKPAGPFSFFRFIFLHPQNHSEKEIEEILIHEYTHVSQWHSADVIVSEIISILCWFNPFLWLLKREVRHNLEYLADSHVLASGYDSRTYQYHLLGLAHQGLRGSSLYNSFNILHLKNRIIMMNKKRTHKWGKAKYLIFIPIIALLLILSNIESISRLTKDMLPSKTATPTEQNSEDSDIDAQGNLDPLVVVGYALDKDTPDKPAASERTVFTVVDEMPQFPGGEKELLKFIAQNVRYPQDAIEDGISGRVTASFIVNEDGSSSDIQILRSVSPSIDAEAKRVLSIMPPWIPGRQKGIDVAVKYTVPITFRLSQATYQPASKPTDDNTAYTLAHTMPQFPGGETELLHFIARQIKYPISSQEAGIQGRVICSFIVEKNGDITNTEIVRGLDTPLDNEAMRVLNTMPTWIPGTNAQGEAIRVKYTIPITYKLQ